MNRTDGDGEGAVFQTNPCGVEATRRLDERLLYDLFQTNPCGVEADDMNETHSDEDVSDEPLWG